MTRPPLAAVTGGSGFLGQAVVGRLRCEGWRVRVLSRRPDPGALDMVAGGIEDETALPPLLEGAQLVVHMAGLTRARDASAFRDVNVAGAARLGAAIRRHAPGARVVAVSSLAAREPQLSPYAASKAEGERALLDQWGGDDWVILRPSALYGPRDPATLPMFRAALLPLQPIPAAPGARLALLHVDDCARAVLAACRSGARGQVWEVGEGAFGWESIARAAARALGRDPALLAVPRPVLAAAVGLLRLVAAGSSPLASPGKLAELLHGDWTCRPEWLPPAQLWSPTIDLRSGFAITAAWYRLHGWL